MNNTAYAAGRTTTRAAVSTVKTAGSAVGTLGVALGSFLAGVAGVEPTAQQTAPATSVADALDRLLDEKFVKYGLAPAAPKAETPEQMLDRKLDERFAKLAETLRPAQIDHPAPAATPAATQPVDQTANIVEALNQLRESQAAMFEHMQSMQAQIIAQAPAKRGRKPAVTQ